MKLSIRIISVANILFAINAYTQDGFKPGFALTINGERIEDSLKLSKGKLILLASGRSKMYSPWDIKNFRIDTSDYISYANDFYIQSIVGTNAGLYQKLTDNSNEKIYNGSEMAGFVKTTEGRRGDYYVMLSTDKELILINRKNFKNYFINLFKGNERVISEIKNGTYKFDQVKELIMIFNKQ